MAKVIIIGATGSLAPYIIDEIKKLQDIQITLFVRNRNRLRKTDIDESSVLTGDAMSFGSLAAAIAGQDIVVVSLAGDLSTMGNNIVEAMKQTGVKRIIVISSIGIYNEPVKSLLSPYRKLADIVESSGLIYTILRPDWFTSVEEVDYQLTKKGQPEGGKAISRKSIASFIARIVANPDLYKYENLGISKPT